MWYPSSGARPAGSENGSAAISGLTLFLAENELHWGCGRAIQPPRPFPSCPRPGGGRSSRCPGRGDMPPWEDADAGAAGSSPAGGTAARGALPCAQARDLPWRKCRWSHACVTSPLAGA